MGLYRNIAGFDLADNASFNLPDTEGIDGGYATTDFYEGTPTFTPITYTTFPINEPPPTVFYDPGTTTFIDNSPPPVTVTDTGGTIPLKPFPDPISPTDIKETIPIDLLPPLVPIGPTTPIDTVLPPIFKPTTDTPTTPTTSVLPLDVTTALKNNLLPLLALAGLVVVAVKGEDLLHSKRKLVYVGGVGLLYYILAKNKTFT
jgi:hypothetical protein